MTTKITIACDIDGVVADLHTEWLRRYNRDYHDDMTSTDIKCWDMAQSVKPECGNKIFDYLHQSDLYHYVSPIAGAIEGVAALREAGHRVVFATAANIDQAGNKLRWLETHRFLKLLHGTSRDYMEMQDKSLIQADLLIDDHAGNCDTFRGRTILFSQPHNASCPDHKRAGDWSEVVTLVNKLTQRSS
jgi:5'-nucleotidase